MVTVCGRRASGIIITSFTFIILILILEFILSNQKAFLAPGVNRSSWPPAGKGLIDPCPLWDDNGKTYLVHAYAGSRAGIKSVIIVKEMNKEGTKITGEAVMVYDGHEGSDN